MDFPVAGAQGMAMKDDDRLIPPAGQPLQTLEQIDLFSRIELLGKPADLPERGCLAEHKRAGGPASDATHRIPHPLCGSDRRPRAVERERAAAGKYAAGDRFGRIIKELRRRMGIRVDEEKPLTSGVRGARIPRARNL